VGDFQLIDKVVLAQLKQMDDYYPYLRGMIANCGFKVATIDYTWKARVHGMSQNKFFHLVDQGLNGLISFTNVPLRLCMLAGFFLSGLSIFYAVVQVVFNLIYYQKFAAPGITTIIVAIFFFSGVQLFFIGVLGEYIGAIHSQVRKRPMVIERERVNF
jgi:glycosyltransferase involved in cell wall biosynthesis